MDAASDSNGKRNPEEPYVKGRNPDSCSAAWALRSLGSTRSKSSLSTIKKTAGNPNNQKHMCVPNWLAGDALT